MSFNIRAIPKFEKDLKRLVKKYPSLKIEYIQLIKSLKENPVQGTSLGRNCYKLRLAVKSKGKGKSGGTRIVTNIVVSETIVYLLTIYDKSDKESLNNKELSELLKDVPE